MSEDRLQIKINSRFGALPLLILVILLGTFCFVTRTNAATLSLSPATGNFAAETMITVSIQVNTDQEINGIEGTLQFPTNKLEVVSVNKNRSIMSLWVEEPSFSNSGQTGIVKFSAIKLNPGFVGSKGTVLDVNFRVKDAGVANITFSSGSILANDGHGSNLLTAFGSGVFTLTRKTIPTTNQLYTPSTPTQISTRSGQLAVVSQLKYWIQDRLGKDVLFNTSDAAPKWSNMPYAKMTWTVPPDVTGVGTLFDDNPDSEPSATATTIMDSQVLPFLTEGKHYFHIRFTNASGAGPTLHLPLFIDLHEPKYFDIEFTDTESNASGVFSTSNPRPRIMFFTEDELSGVDHYEFKINNSDWYTAELERDGTFVLPKVTPETRQDLIIRAYDVAGNFVDADASVSIEPIVSPVVTFYPRNIDISNSASLIIDGRSAPGATVEVVLAHTDPITIPTRADDHGSWRMSYSKALPAGVYSVRVRQILDNGAESSFTEPITIRVNMWSGKIMQWLSGYGWYVVVLTFFVLSELGTLFFYRRAMRRIRAGLNQKYASVANSVSERLSFIEEQIQSGTTVGNISNQLNQLKDLINKDQKDPGTKD